MHSDSLHPLSLSERVRAVQQQTTRLVTLRDRLTEELAQREAEVRDLGLRIEKLSKTAELFRMLMDVLVNKQVKAVEDVVTQGLQSIFHDLNLTFEAEVGEKYGKTSIEFFLRQGAKTDPLSHRARPVEGFGGGPSSVASLTLRVLTIFKLRLWPIIVLDEALNAVSDEYVDATARFLASLTEKMGVDILLVTHKAGFLDHAKRAYRCGEVVESDDTRHLTLRSIK